MYRPNRTKPSQTWKNEKRLHKGTNSQNQEKPRDQPEGQVGHYQRSRMLSQDRAHYNQGGTWV